MSSRSDSPAPVAPLASVMRHKILVSILVALGAAIGVGLALLNPPPYLAEARVAVVPANTNAYSIAGYPLGARELAGDYARWVQNHGSDGEWVPEGVSAVTASPIPDSAVIRLEVEAATEEEARSGVEHVAQTLMQQVEEAGAQHDPERAYAQFEELSPQVASARATAAASENAYNRAVGAGAAVAQQNQLRQAWEDDLAALAQLQLRQDAVGQLYRQLYTDTAGNSNLELVAPAASQGNPMGAAMARYGVVGAGAGGLLALLLVVMMDRRSPRRAAARD
ncbi:MAG: hypothetical protein Q4G43_05680 [Mobilicoccus sp.]|nr:hypothetical protein [Mobilicoccus sp.]